MREIVPYNFDPHRLTLLIRLIRADDRGDIERAVDLGPSMEMPPAPELFQFPPETMETLVVKMKRCKVTREMLRDAIRQVADQIADQLEDEAGWHGAERQGHAQQNTRKRF